MNQQPPQDISARRNPTFDCELPPDVRAEFYRPKRARILVPPEPPKRPSGGNSERSGANIAGRWLWTLFFVLTLVVLAGRFATTPASHPIAAPPAVQTLDPSLNRRSSPAATPAAVVPIPVPRAQLVRLPAPVPRGQLVRLPSQQLIRMPYGTEVLATLRGGLGSEAQLPRVGHIGDLYVVGTTPWIWVQVPGTAAPTWVDP